MFNFYSIKKRIKKEGETAELLCLLSGYYDVNKKDFQKALKYAEKAIIADKNYGYAYYRKGATLYSLGKTNEAYEYLQKAAKLGYEYHELFGILSHILSKQNNYQQALIYANKAISLNEKYANGYCVKGIAEYHLKDKENALKSFFLAKKLGCKNDSVYDFISYILYEKNEYKKALKYVSKAIKAQPDNSRLHLLEGCILVKLDKDDEAKEKFLKLEKLGCKSDILYSRLSDIYFYENNYEKSLEYANKAVLIDSEDGYFRYRQGMAYYNLKNYKKAQAAFQKAEQSGYKDDDMYGNMSYIFSAEDDFSSSLKYANKALFLNSKRGYFHYRRGFALFFLEKFKEAKDCYLKAEQLGYQYEGMFYHLAGIFYLESDFDTALSYINKAIIKRSNDIDYYSVKAEILLSMGKQKEADKCYQKINELKNKK